MSGLKVDSKTVTFDLLVQGNRIVIAAVAHPQRNTAGTWAPPREGNRADIAGYWVGSKTEILGKPA